MTTDETVLLDSTLRPSPPMQPTSLRRVIAAVLAANLVFAFGFVLRGAWLVTPFMGLDVVLLAWAFAASLRRARHYERVMVTSSTLVVERHPPGQPPSQVAFNPYWVRVEMADPTEHESQLILWSNGKG